MIRSMTGYGEFTLESKNHTVFASIKSVNSKGLDISIKMPKSYSNYEYELRNILGIELIRGKAFISVEIHYSESSGRLASINKTALKHYLEQLKEVSEEFNLPMADILKTSMTLPEVIKINEEENPEEWEEILNTVKSAIVDFNKHRMSEGESLRVILEELVQNIKLKALDIVNFEAERISNLRDKLQNSLNELSSKLEYNKERFEQELIYYIEKIDISEEKQRLAHHCDYFLEHLNSSEDSGRKLSFISQEMGREINTIGSKANHLNIQKLVVEMKDDLEKIKEQLANIL